MKTLIEYKRRVFGHDGTAINRHSTRRYRDTKGLIYELDRTLDGVPPFYEVHGPITADHVGVVPHLKVMGLEYWGDGWSWRKAERALCRELKARIVRRTQRRRLGDEEAQHGDIADQQGGSQAISARRGRAPPNPPFYPGRSCRV